MTDEEKKGRTLGAVIRRLRKDEPEKEDAGEPDRLTSLDAAPNAGEEIQNVEMSDVVVSSLEERLDDPSGEDGNEDADQLSDLINTIRNLDEQDPGEPTLATAVPVSPDEEEEVLEVDESVETVAVPSEEEEETLREFIDDLINTHDEEDEGTAPVELGEKDPPAATITPAKAKKTRWSEGGSDASEKSVIKSVDEIGDLSDLVLPSGATFEVEDIHLASSSAFDLVDKGTVLSEIDEIWKPGLPSSEVAGDVTVADKEVEIEKGLLRGIFKPRRAKFEEYDPRIHGPLVNLSLDLGRGQEEVELYPVNEPYAYVRVTYDNTAHEHLYQVIEPELNRAEEELLSELEQRLFETLDVNTKGMTHADARMALRNAVDEILMDYGIKLTPANREKILYHIEKNFLGDGLIDAIMHDKYIEDISCDGLNTPLFVYHTGYESTQTNLMYTDSAKLDSFVTRLAQRAGKYISISDPMLDATMADGSRIQMTLGREVTAHGSTFTIRKFREEPITPTDLIEWHTFSPLSIAFFWLAVESGKSCIFAGGTASGKTTSLNAISLFIPPLAKIVTLEDTRELKLPHPNWIPSVTRDSFDTGGKGEINMYELLRAALRQRPEYLLVGEVRGHEALTLFQAMSTGHVTYSTMHADSVASVVHRLENPPLNVPRNMLNALDLVSVQIQARVGGQRIRRNKQLIEILDIDPRTNELITNEVFKWNASTDEIRYSGKSYILEEIMEERGWSEARMREELKRRQEILEWMRLKKLRHYKDVSKVLVSYHRDPEAVMEIVRADLYE